MMNNIPLGNHGKGRDWNWILIQEFKEFIMGRIKKGSRKVRFILKY
jgi:hypothetical protein